MHACMYICRQRKRTQNIYWCSFDDLLIVYFVSFHTNASQLQKFLNSETFYKNYLCVKNKNIITDKSSYQLDVVIRAKECFL